MRIFKEGCSETNEITLHDIDAVSFEIILEFIYLSRKPCCNEDNIYELLRSSDFLNLQTVKNICVVYILKEASYFSPTGVFELFHLASGMNDSLLMDTLSKYCVIHFQDFVRKDFFVEMAYDCLNLVLQQYRLSTLNFSSENFILDAVV